MPGANRDKFNLLDNRFRAGSRAEPGPEGHLHLGPEAQSRSQMVQGREANSPSLLSRGSSFTGDLGPQGLFRSLAAP